MQWNRCWKTTPNEHCLVLHCVCVFTGPSPESYYSNASLRVYERLVPAMPTNRFLKPLPDKLSLILRLYSKEHHRQTSKPTIQEPLFLPHHHRLEPPQWGPGEGPHTCGLQTTDRHPDPVPSNSHWRTRAPPVASVPNVGSCNVMESRSRSRPSIAWRREAWKEEALDDPPWKDEREPSSIRRTLELVQRQPGGETFLGDPWSACAFLTSECMGLFTILNWSWTELNLSNIKT